MADDPHSLAERLDTEAKYERTRRKAEMMREAAALLRQMAAPGWRTIDSAPKDGTEFLAALSNGWVTILYATEAVRSPTWRFAWWGSPRGQSVPYEPSHPADTNWDETHTSRAVAWMPLPSAPTGETE